MIASEHSATALQVDTMATSSMDMEVLLPLPLLLHPQVSSACCALRLPFLTGFLSFLPHMHQPTLTAA